MFFVFLIALLAVPPTQLTWVSTTSAATVKPGGVAKLVLDITPGPKMHVYAPGAKDYVPIELELNSAGVRAGKLTYPPSQDWYFEPTKEHIPVYQAPFKLAQDIVIASTVKPGTLIVTGVLKYQACDDTICYNPVTAPVSWTVSVK